MTWKERYVQFWWKAHCFPVLQRIWGQCDDFENFDPHKCDLAKPCCSWRKKRVLYNFHNKRTFLPFWKDFQASLTILRTLTLTNAILPKRAAHDLKRAFCTIFMETALFSTFGENFRPVWPIWELWRSKMRFGQNVLRMTWNERFVQFLWKAHYFLVLERIWGQCDGLDNFDAQKCDLTKTCSAWPEKSVLYNFHGKGTVFPFWKEFRPVNFGEFRPVILRSLTFKNALSPKRAAHDLKRGFCTIFIISALFCLFGEIFRPVWRFLTLWRSQMRFGQNVLRTTWKKRFVQFLWKAHCFPVLQRIWGQCDDFENFDAHKCELAKTCCSWPKKRVLYNFYGKRTVFPFWREFEASVTILTTLTLTNAIWPKRAPHDLKRALCTISMESALFSRFAQNLRPVWRFWELWRSQMRFDQNVLRMTWKERYVQFPWKAHCFPVLQRIWGQCDDFENFDAHKCELAKTCCSWPKKRVLYNFYGKRTVFSFWRDFQASVTIFNTLTLTNAIWPKRAPHDLKRGFCTIFMESALFSRFEENLRPVWRFWQLWRSKMRFG